MTLQIKYSLDDTNKDKMLKTLHFFQLDREKDRSFKIDQLLDDEKALYSLLKAHVTLENKEAISFGPTDEWWNCLDNLHDQYDHLSKIYCDSEEFERNLDRIGINFDKAVDSFLKALEDTAYSLKDKED